jgi:BNR repeat-containing family member
VSGAEEAAGRGCEVIRFNDYNFKSNDAHNIISIGICPQDGTIHLAFDHHGHSLHYRVSQKGVATDPEKVKWNAVLFSPINSELEKWLVISG